MVRGKGEENSSFDRMWDVLQKGGEKRKEKGEMRRNGEKMKEKKKEKQMGNEIRKGKRKRGGEGKQNIQ